MSADTGSCRACGRALPRAHRAGRPRLYCRSAGRRARVRDAALLSRRGGPCTAELAGRRCPRPAEYTLFVSGAPGPGRTGRKDEEPAQPTRLLLVEDDDAIREALCLALTRQGYEVMGEGTGRAGLRSAYLQRPDLVLLDVMLPDIDGMEVLRRLRAVSDVPVIYLTARSDPIDVIVGLETGADDYIVKPCQAREIDARIRRVLYRYRAAERRDGDVYDDGLLRLDSLQQQAWAAGVLLPLSRTEFRVLDRLVRHTGTVQHFGTLLAAGWGAASPGARDRVKFTVSRLRGKLDATPVGGGSIVSVRGMGYLYRSPTTPSLPPSPKPTAASTGYGHTRPARRVPRAGPCGGEVAGPDVSQRRRRLARWRQSTYPLVSHCSAVPLFR